MPDERKIDRRVQRTRRVLHEALGSLIHEKPYDAIAVKEILGRADVGRSTFYAHFRDKGELLESGIRDLLRHHDASTFAVSGRLADRLLAFSLPVFEHIRRYQGAGDSPVDASTHTVVHERLEREIAERVAVGLERMVGHRGGRGAQVPRELLARHVASTFTLVLTWWLATDAPLSASAANDVFRALVSPALDDLLG